MNVCGLYIPASDTTGPKEGNQSRQVDRSVGPEGTNGVNRCAALRDRTTTKTMILVEEKGQD
jgi:hypothetical protein